MASLCIFLQIDILRLWTWHQLLTAWDEGRDLQRKVVESCDEGHFSALSFVMRGNVYCSFVSVCFCLFHLWVCQMFALFPTAKQHLDIFCFLLHLCCFRCFCEQLLESYLWVSPRTSCYWRCKPWMQGQDNLTNKKQHKSSRRIQGDKTKRPRTSECPLRPRCENMRKVKYRILSSRKHIMNMTSLFQTKWVFLLNSTECFFQAQPWDSFNLRQV